MNVRRVSVGPLEVNCWLVDDGEGGPVVVIDPGDEADRVLGALEGGTVAAIVLTHAHFDHVGAAGAVKDATGAPLMVHEADADRITHDAAHGTGGALFGFSVVVAPPADVLLRDADVIEAGCLRFDVLHTPGHTQGGISLYVRDPNGGTGHLFSGDTVFAGSVGRTDFPGGDGRTLAESIARQLAPLPPETLVHPGHGPDTTIGREARINPFWPRA